MAFAITSMYALLSDNSLRPVVLLVTLSNRPQYELRKTKDRTSVLQVIDTKWSATGGEGGKKKVKLIVQTPSGCAKAPQKMLERLVTLCLLLKRLKTGRGKIKVVCCSLPKKKKGKVLAKDDLSYFVCLFYGCVQQKIIFPFPSRVIKISWRLSKSELFFFLIKLLE